MPNKITSRGIIGRFYRTLEQTTGASWVDAVSMHIPSDQAKEEYAWLGMAPSMREFKNGRQTHGLREFSYEISNKEYEATMEIPVAWMRRDKTGQINLRVDEMADRAAAHWSKLLSTLIENGESTACYDSQYFFDTDHSEGDSGSQSNDITYDISAAPVSNHGSTTAPSAGEMIHAILAGVEKMLSFKDDQGEPMNETARNFAVMVPTSYYTSAVAALKNGIIDGGDVNTIANFDGFNLSLAVNPRLTWTDKFSLWRTDSRVKACIRQEEVPIKVSAIAEGSELEFKDMVHHYGIYASRAVGYGYWQNACLVKLV